MFVDGPDHIYRWRIDAGIGDNYMRLCRPEARKMFALCRRGRCEITGYVFGLNADLLWTLYEPMVTRLRRVQSDQEFYQVAERRSAEWALREDVPEDPLDWCWTSEEVAEAHRILQGLPRPWLMIQEVGGRHDGPTGLRKHWGRANWRKLLDRWATTGGGAVEFGKTSAMGLPVGSSLRVATLLGSLVDCVVGPESAVKYFGPLFNQRCVTIWSKFHDFTVEDQLAGWYKPIETSPHGRQRVLGIGRTAATETSPDEVWGAVQAVMTESRPRIALATAFRDRPEYLRQMLDTAQSSQWPTSHEFAWWFSDDTSNAHTQQMLRDATPGLEVAFRGRLRGTRNDRPLGCDRNVLRAVYNTLSWNPQWVCTVDSDMVLHPRWMVVLLEALTTLQAQGVNVGALTAFNSRQHRTLGTFAPGIVRKNSIGGPCTLIRVDILRELALQQKATIYWGRGEPGWDWKLTHYLRDRKIEMAALSPSYAQHIGEQGAHAIAGSGFDAANDFVGIDLDTR